MEKSPNERGLKAAIKNPNISGAMTEFHWSLSFSCPVSTLLPDSFNGKKAKNFKKLPNSVISVFVISGGLSGPETLKLLKLCSVTRYVHFLAQFAISTNFLFDIVEFRLESKETKLPNRINPKSKNHHQQTTKSADEKSQLRNHEAAISHGGLFTYLASNMHIFLINNSVRDNFFF